MGEVSGEEVGLTAEKGHCGTAGYKVKAAGGINTSKWHYNEWENMGHHLLNGVKCVREVRELTNALIIRPSPFMDVVGGGMKALVER